METTMSDWIKISARMPRGLVRTLSRLYPKKNLSELLRKLVEGEISRKKTLKAHMKMYGRFKPAYFDESLL